MKNIKLLFNVEEPLVRKVCLILFILVPLFASAQYIWQKGDSTINQLSVYGTQGVYDAANHPGGRSGATTWRDASGNLWLFGGNGYGASGGSGRLSDLWKFDITTDQWEWLKGPTSINNTGTYGTMGTAAAGNTPGGREVAANWVDNSGYFWIFGGYGFGASGSAGRLNDLWKYDPGTNNWTWMKGPSDVNNNGVYGTLGTEAAANIPGGRYHCVGTVDPSGNLIFFGGNGLGSSSPATGGLNDLWRYNISTNNFTWIAGSNARDQLGTYGTLGVEASANKPGARVHSAIWTQSNGDFWMFGGYGRGASGLDGYLNDLWKYNVSTGYFAWMSGDNTIDNTGVYNDSCSGTAANKPGGRSAPIFWRDAGGDVFWLHGGEGRSTSSTVGDLHDLFAYDVSTGFWAWLSNSGINVNGSYTSIGSTGFPGGRNHSAGWISSTELWLHGGIGYPRSGSTKGYLSDLWKLPFLTPCGGTISALPIVLSHFSARVDGKQVRLSWITESEINNDYFSVERSDNRWNFTEVIRVAGAGNSSAELHYSTTDKHPLFGTSYYRLKQTDYDGHNSNSKAASVRIEKEPEVTIDPNPSDNYFIVAFEGVKSFSIQITGFTQSYLFESNNIIGKTRIDVTDFPKGIYFLKAYSGKTMMVKKLVII
ncbi:MAG TPA: kelch repeat-containing protein [Bacteroidia bacterium]|nr:kelch repeat-containing protein [Bacteroidia bacterium]